MNTKNTKNSELADWIDQQTANEQAAVLLIYDDGADIGHVYLANGPAFGMPVVCALDVPRAQSQEIGAHLDFLCDDHRTGNPVRADQTTAQKVDGGYAMFRLTKPDARARRKLMRDELAQSHYRWPEADVLILQQMPSMPLH